MTAHDGTLEALETLQRELHHLGWQTRLHTDERDPFLRICLDAAYREHVFAAGYDEPNYTWASTSRQHPLNDPVGAAERIVGDLALRLVQQGLTRSRL